MDSSRHLELVGVAGAALKAALFRDLSGTRAQVLDAFLEGENLRKDFSFVIGMRLPISPVG